MIKSLWAMVQGDPVFMRRVNGWMTLFWIVMISVSLFTGWINSVTYVAVLSLWALVSGHWSAWQAARVEVKQDEQADGSATDRRPVDRADNDGHDEYRDADPEQPHQAVHGESEHSQNDCQDDQHNQQRNHVAPPRTD